MSEDASRPDERDERPAAAAAMRCDFCGQPAARVRRVALDSGYDRLQVRHAERYACPTCSEKKERQRTGAAPS
jgi:hypothetical protein